MIGVDGKSVRRWRSGERRPKTNEPIRDILNHVGADGETRARVLTALGNTTPEEVVRLLGGEPVNAEAVALPNAAA